MPEKSGVNNLYSGRSVVKNTIYNLLGMGLPLLLAFFIIPMLIKGFGEEKFGILNLAWIVIGYFSFFDLGIGRTLTKVVAEKLGEDKHDEISSVFWTSIILISAVSIAGMIIFFFISPLLVYNILNISVKFREETLYTFYLLALSIPIVTISAGLRGVLEAYQKFALINIIRIILGVFTFLGPLVSLFFTNSLFWVVLILIILRVAVWVIYLFYTLRLDESFKKGFRFSSGEVRPIIKLSGWITLSNILSPTLVYMDRVLIGAFLSASAITYYATPLELVSRLLLIPSAIVGVLFPVFSASYLNKPDFSRKLFRMALKFIIIIVFPIILLIITFAYEGMGMWLGSTFAKNSSLVLQLFSIGILFNSIAFFPFTYLQSIGKAQIPSILYLVELPLYFLFLWLGIKNYAIIGAAWVWLIRIIFDAAVLLYYSNKLLKFQLQKRYLGLLIVFIIPFIPLFMTDLYGKILFIFITIILFSFISWNYFLRGEEKNYLNLSFLKKNAYANKVEDIY